MLVVAGAVGLAAYWWLTTPPAQLAVTARPYTPDPANGETTFNVGGCSSCHAMPEPARPHRLGGGLALASPFGTFYAPNISPDPNDGIGKWSETDFVRAVTKGISPEGTHYFPAFPYTSYAHAKSDDVRDLFAYLKTLPAVARQRARPRSAVSVQHPPQCRHLEIAVLRRSSLHSRSARPPSWNRGAYLVNSFGHCAECHSPRNLLGGIIARQRFAGGPDPEGKGWVPNITRKGTSDWSEKDIAYFLETGQTPDGDSAGGSMVPVIKNISQLSATDRDAIAEYIKSLPPVEGPPKPPKKKTDG